MSILSKLARIFQRPAYTSDITRAIETLKKDHPELEARQLAGRARLWDVAVNSKRNRQEQRASIPQSAYVYQTRSDYPAPPANTELP